MPSTLPNEYEFFKDLKSFFRKIRLTKFFEGREYEPGVNISGLKPKSNFTPSLQQVDKNVEIFERVVEIEIRQLWERDKKHMCINNMSKEHRTALKSLQDDVNIVIQ